MAVEIISTVLIAATASAPASPYDLTDLSTVHDELSLKAGDTSFDSWLSRAITQASGTINSYCNRVFQVETLQDQVFIQQDHYPYQLPGGVYPLQLSRWPLQQLSGLTQVVAFTGNTHGTTTVDGITSTVGLSQGQLVFAADGSIPAGTTIASPPGSNSITLSAAATTTVTGQSLNTGIQVIQTLGVGYTQVLVWNTDFTVDPRRGWLLRLNPWTGASEKWEAQPLTVQYQAGYTTVPSDVVDACLRLVTQRYAAKGRDPMLMEQTQPAAGTQRYWVGSTPGTVGALSPEIQALIEPYRVPVTA